MKTAADQARAMGDYIREHGFSPLYREHVNDRCGCFVHAYDVTWNMGMPDNTLDIIWPAIALITGAKTYQDEDLIAAGYASDADRSKAVEACYAAARLLEGK